MLRYVKAIALFAALLIGYLLLQIAVAAVFAAVGGIGAADISAAMAQYVMDNAQLITIVTNVALVLLIALLSERGKPRREALRLKPLPFGAVLPSIILGAGAACLTVSLLMLLPLPEPLVTDYAASHEELMGGSVLMQLLLAVLLAPLAEELLFRLMIYGVLRKAFSAPVAAALSAFSFGMLHGSALWAGYAVAAGLMLAAVYEISGSLYAPVIVHIFFNLFGSFVLPALQAAGLNGVLMLLIGLAAAAYSARRLLLTCRTTADIS